MISENVSQADNFLAFAFLVLALLVIVPLGIWAGIQEERSEKPTTTL